MTSIRRRISVFIKARRSLPAASAPLSTSIRGMDTNLRHQLFLAAVESGLITHETPMRDASAILVALMERYEHALESKASVDSRGEPAISAARP